MNIYQENVLDHYKNPHHHGHLADATATVEQSNPLCGDRLVIQVEIDGTTLEGYRFTGEGCAISIAAASMLGGLAEGRALAEIRAIRDDNLLAELGVPLSPTRTKCALLALSGLRRAVM